MEKTLLNNRIEQFCRENKYNSFQIDDYNYQIPKALNIEAHRVELLTNESSFETSFKHDVDILLGKKKKGLEYIQEFPIVIDNLDLWNYSLDCFKETNEDFRNRKYFMLDFLLPSSGIIIEIDSIYHKEKELYDQARDFYISSRFGLETIRFFEYGKDPILRKEYKSRLEKQAKLSYQDRSRNSNCLVEIDQTDAIVYYYFKVNRGPLILIEKLMRHFGLFKFKTTSMLEIDSKQLKKLYPEIKKYTQEELDLFINTPVKTQLWNLFKKEIVVKP